MQINQAGLCVDSETNNLDLDDTDAIWDALGEQLEGFITAWDANRQDPPDIGDFALTGSSVARHLSLVELIKIDLEYRWKLGQQRFVEDYVELFPELQDEEGVATDLIYEEFHVRRQCGDEVGSHEYLTRFPSQKAALERLLGLEGPEQSSSFVGKPKLDLKPGDTLDDFDLINTLGEGSFAAVFLARQRSMQRMVALKISYNEGREHQTLAQLDHPHIVRVFDQRVHESAQWRLLYMQYVPGCTLHDVISHFGQRDDATGATVVEAIDQGLERLGEELSSSPQLQRLENASREEAVCLIGMQMAEALEYAHGKGVLHRDLKPANVLLNREGTIKLVDFNISFCSKLEGATAGANFGGSLAYMSPEQLDAMNPNQGVDADDVTAASDVYSMGVVLWELLTGARPFQDQMSERATTTLELMSETRRNGLGDEQVQKVTTLGSGVVGEVAARCLDPERSRRLPSAASVLRELKLCLHPRVRRLLVPGSWQQLLQRWGMLAMVLAVVLPNALAGVFNYVYNEQNIIRRLADSDGPFFFVQLTINGLAFPLGAFWGLMLCRPVLRAVGAIKEGRPVDDELMDAARVRALRLGHYFAMISIVEWMIAGVAYPVALHLSGVSMTGIHYAHFIGSLAVCGMIAMSYPFFAGTGMVLYTIYPRLLAGKIVPDTEIARLETVHRRSWFYLAIAALVPMLGVAILLGLSDVPARTALIGLCGFGLLGFAVVVWLARRMNRTVAALQRYLE